MLLALAVGLVAVLAVGAAYVIDLGGEVRIALGTMEFSLTPLAGMIGLTLMLIAGWVIFRLAGLLVAMMRFFNGDETALSRYFDRNRERKGFEALADGLMAGRMHGVAWLRTLAVWWLRYVGSGPPAPLCCRA